MVFVVDLGAREETGEESSQVLEGSPGPEEAILEELHTENWGSRARGETRVAQSVDTAGGKILGIVVAADNQEEQHEGPEVVEVFEKQGWAPVVLDATYSILGKSASHIATKEYESNVCDGS